MDEAISENVLAGNIMSRRALYSYGLLLPHNAQGNVGNGLGVTLATGDPSIIAPTKTIVRTGEKMIIDGLEFDFLMTPGSEAPAEMHFYIPALKACVPPRTPRIPCTTSTLCAARKPATPASGPSI